MNSNDLKGIAKGLIDEFNYAAKESIRLYEEGLKIQIKDDKSPVANLIIGNSKLFSIKVILNESHIAAASYEKKLNE